MRYLLLTVIFISVLFTGFTSDTFSIRVIDGDTVDIVPAITEQHFKLRLYGIDAPEHDQPCGDQAKQLLEKLVSQGTIVWYDKYNKPDRYGRSIVVMRGIDTLSINERMVRSGCAWAYVEFLKREDKHHYILLEDSARAERRGLWGLPNPIKPSEFRKLKHRH